MTTTPPENAPADGSSSGGPWYTAIAATAVAGLLLLALICQVPINLNTTLWLIVPAATLSSMLVACALGWIFVLFGRQHRTARHLIGTCILIGITMITLLTVIILAVRAGGMGS